MIEPQQTQPHPHPSQAHQSDGAAALAALKSRTEGLIPQLRERAAQAEADRRVPAESIAAMQAIGLMRAFQPARFGGYEVPFHGMVELPAMLARGCGSSSWVYANLASHSWMLGMWPAQAQDEIWGVDPDAMIASALIYRCGRAKKVAGGYRVTGRWPFSSGIDPSSWNMFGAIVQDEEGTPGESRMFLVPVGEYEIIDTWHVVGLAGTGSKDVALEDFFVPEHRTLAAAATLGGPTPGSAANPGTLYRLPMRALISYCIAGTALGIAQGVVAQFTHTSRTRLTTYTGKNLADFTTVQMRIAEAAALTDAARALLLRNCDEAQALTAAGTVPALEQKAGYRRDGAFATTLCARAVDLLYTASGGAAIYEQNPIQRAFRDIHAASAHFGLNFDVNGSGYGRVALGLPPDGPL